MASKIHQSETEKNNQKLVTALYEAINAKDVRTVKRLLAPDLEWWFHGPPSQQHLMRFLTGRLDSTHQNNCSSFVFKPLSVVAFGSLVLVEGFHEKNSVTWVHAWSVADGIITQVREYFNTFVSVTRLGRSNHLDDDHTKPQPQEASAKTNKSCRSIWQSKLADNSAMPALVLPL